MPKSLDRCMPELLSLVDLTVAALLGDAPLPDKRRFRGAWRSAWGRCAYGNGVSDDDLAELTRARKHCLDRIFSHTLAALRRAMKEDNKNAVAIRQRLVARRINAPRHLAAVLLAIEASLDLLWLEQHTGEGGPRLRLAICCSVFGDIAGTVTGQAQELRRLFRNVPAELHIFAVAGMDDAAAVPAAVDSVRIHFRRIALSELVALPGIKAPSLVGACADAVSNGADLIVTTDGDGRLPLWEVIPAIAAVLQSPMVDAALGSRRVAGALVSKPGLRHLTSLMNAAYVGVHMGPVMGSIRDPQAIFKVYRTSRLECALRRLGHDGVHGWSLNGLQDGSLACELMLLANLADNSRRPRLVEVPAVETMAYPASPARMPILTGGQASAMIAAVRRPRDVVRERSLLGEGTEAVVLRGAGGEAVKFPRFPERPAVRGPLPTSRVADNRLVQSAMSFKGALNTVMCSLAARSHSDRGFGVTPGAINLMSDDRREVKKCLPAGLDLQCLDNAIRLPFPSAVVLELFWQIDRWLWSGGAMLEWIGMLPLVLVRIIGFGVRIGRLIGRTFRLIARPAKTILLKVALWSLRLCDLLAPVARRSACRVVKMLELAGVLRVFAVLDRLDQRSRVFHACLRAIMRVLVERRWLLEGFNVSVHFGRPVPCIVQRQPLRPFWTVLKALPASMTEEVSRLLYQALEVYRSLGEAGYFDAELSIDNLGFVIEGGRARPVLMDFGAVVNARHCQPEFLRCWLEGIKEDFAQSFQVFKLRRYARGNRETQQAVDNYIDRCVGLVDRWMQVP